MGTSGRTGLWSGRVNLAKDPLPEVSKTPSRWDCPKQRIADRLCLISLTAFLLAPW